MVSLSSVTVLINSRISKWQTATWDDYLAYRDHPNLERVKLFYQEGYLLIEMGAEGINHASMSDLFTMLFALVENSLAALWFNQQIANINIKE